MRRTTVIISMILVLAILTVSIPPVLAESVSNLDENEPVSAENKISDILKEKMEEADEDEKIPVWIWYEDIDQDNVDRITESRAGYTAEECDVITESFPQDDFKGLIKDSSDSLYRMKDYLSRTASARNIEEELTENYISIRRKVSTEKYKEKSNCLVSNLQICRKDILFSSEFAPMIIAQLSSQEIIEIATSPDIESVSLYSNNEQNSIDEVFDDRLIHESINQESTPSTYEMMTRSMGLEKVYDELNNYGDGVKIGLIEGDLPGIIIDDAETYGIYEFDSHNLLNVVYDYETEFDTVDSIVEDAIDEFEETPGNSVKVVTLVDEDFAAWANVQTSLENFPTPHGHANNSARIMIGDQTGLAKGAVVYATLNGGHGANLDVDLFVNTEALMKCNVSIIEVNIECFYGNISPEYYLNAIKYNDHIVYNHSVSLVLPTGNGYEETNSPYKQWINPIALSYNCIAVGAYRVDYDEQTQSIIETREYFKWQNANQNGDVYCEKPDVILPDNCGEIIGTSISSPAMAAIIALMVKLEPALRLKPHILKAIILASCHRKANPNPVANEDQEFITDGLSERQGAGIPDAWTIMQIIIQHTYASGQSNANSSFYYNVNTNSIHNGYLNFSMTWLRPTSATNSHYSNDDIRDYSIGDLDLYLENNSSVLSEHECSSTEMCYSSLSQGQVTSRFRIVNQSQYTVDYLACAWSTRDKELEYAELSGKTAVGQELGVEAYCDDETLAPISELDYQWYRSNDGINWTSINNATLSTYTLTANDFLQYIKCEVTPNNNSSISGALKFDTTAIRIIQFGDVDLDGYISIFDVGCIERKLYGLISLSAEAKYAADVNGNGNVDLNDAFLIQQYLSGAITSFPIEN